MGYDTALFSTTPLIDFEHHYSDDYEDVDEVALAHFEVKCEEYSRLLNEIVYATYYPKLATEGFFGSITEFITTVFNTAISAVVGVCDWISKKIAASMILRKRKKSMRDQQFAQLTSMYKAMNASQRQQADAKFANYSLQHMPSETEYLELCKNFETLIVAMDTQVQQHVAKDIESFQQENEQGHTSPTWVVKLYENAPIREALLKFGIKFIDNNFQRQSIYLNLPALTFQDLGWSSIDKVAIADQAYNKHVWPKVVVILSLKDRFEVFEKELKAVKDKIIKKDETQIDKKTVAASCKNVVDSSRLAVRLTSFLAVEEEALDTRRAWLIEHALKVCSSTIKEDLNA